MRPALSLTILALLAACGADAPPERPKGATPAVTVSGDARIGVTGTL